MVDLETLQAGPGLDALIAERIAGQTLEWYHERLHAIVLEPDSLISNGGRGIYLRCTGCDLHGYGNEIDWAYRCPTPPCPAYSTDIAVAWQVVEHLRQTYHFALISRGRVDGLSDHAPGWQAEFSPYGPSTQVYRAIAETPALAICRAALSCAQGIVVDGDLVV